MDLSRRLAEHVVFVLVQPQHPGNVGAAARAMANMGLERLVVVDPAPSFDVERARWMAPGATVVFERLQLVADLETALRGAHVAVATTARHRKHGQPVHTPGALAGRFVEDDPERTLAVLFGKEDTGLAAEDVTRCESILRIPTAEHASLNLGQAVLLVAHALFEAASAAGMGVSGRVVRGRSGRRTTHELDRRASAGPPADVTQLEPAVVELVALLNRVGYTRTASPEKVGVLLREALQRARLADRHVRALRGMVGRIDYALDHPEVSWQVSRRQREALEALRAVEGSDPVPDGDG